MLEEREVGGLAAERVAFTCLTTGVPCRLDRDGSGSRFRIRVPRLSLISWMMIVLIRVPLYGTFFHFVLRHTMIYGRGT